ncbi:MAG TPA: xanthine dehydrogenase accessory protein XdhC [Acetobacteraceae bacterium]|jgi:xanthine dehydrogenase accessory factor
MTQEWLRALHVLDHAGEPAVLVTVLSARGSTPREAGCKMVVARDAVFSTIGGGNLEFVCIDAARDLLDDARGPVTRDFPLGPALGQCCGGHVTVLFEPIRPARLHVAVFGAGHVGRALVRVLHELPLRVTWIDSRPDTFPADRPANVATMIVANPADHVAHLPAGTFVLVMTHDHQIDFAITAAALARDDLAAVGLIGSATKRARFVRRFAAIGLGADAIERLICPIGLPGVGGKLPAEIAISVAAQVLQFAGAAGHREDRKPAPPCHCEAALPKQSPGGLLRRYAPNKKQGSPLPLREGLGEGCVHPPTADVRTPPPAPPSRGGGNRRQAVDVVSSSRGSAEDRWPTRNDSEAVSACDACRLATAASK